MATTILTDAALPALLSFRAAAATTGLSTSTLRKFAREGRLKTAKLGARRMVHRSDLGRLIEEGSRA
jgi:excisionase family DNA binding protein